MVVIDWSLFDTLDSAPINVSVCCDNPELINDVYIKCLNCGRMDTSVEFFVCDHFDGTGTLKYKQPYKRLVYLKQKMGLINCDMTYPLHPRILHFIKTNKGKKYSNLKKLKKAMKRAKLNKWYKFIYSIYHDITGTKKVNINYKVKEFIIRNFIKLEKIFIDKKVRKNIYSYNVVIYFLLKKYGYPDYANILLPYNGSKIKKIVGSLLKLI